jgi:hypothetical protein
MSFSVISIVALWSLSLFGPETTQKTQTQTDAAKKVSVCDLKRNIGGYNHQLVELTGFISHGFEDFSIFDPGCAEYPNIWLEYGGTKNSDTMYCCGVVPGQTRPKQVSVEGVSIPLIEDERFKEFEQMIKGKGQIIHGKIIGRFFAGAETKTTKGSQWGGYGHMGCCSLLMIQQVLSVDPQNRTDLDYLDSPDQPDLEDGCGSSDLSLDWRFSEAIKAQKQIEFDRTEWAFTDPERVAIEALAKLTNIPSTSIVRLIQKRKGPGRVVYEWKPKTKDAVYMVVVSRPYALSFYAADPNKIPWVVIAAYRSTCS